MNDRAEELRAAADAINPESLEAAKVAVAASCEEYISWAELFSSRLETVDPGELHKFARAFSLTLLGHLPTRPRTCPFCIQYGKDKSCTGCGYAATHGRCDADDSAFSLFIEAFQELGGKIYRDTEVKSVDFRLSAEQLRCHLQDTRYLAKRMMEDITECSAFHLMELKAQYLDEMIKQLPSDLFSSDVAEKCRDVKIKLMKYW
jgi:hypothetical protein